MEGTMEVLNSVTSLFTNCPLFPVTSRGGCEACLLEHTNGETWRTSKKLDRSLLKS